MRIALPYHHAYLQAEVPDDRVFAVLQPKLPAEAFISQEQIVEKALAQPVGSAPLHELAKAASRVLMISSDHTRPVPSKIIMPLILHCQCRDR